MGRKKINIEYIENEKDRKMSFKKRRFGLLKKAMELCALSNCHIEINIHWTEDNSLVKYNSQKIHPLPSFDSSFIDKYANLSNLDYEEFVHIESQLTKSGSLLKLD